MTSKNNWKGESFLSWQDIESQVKILCTKIKKTGFEFDTIGTISRGGLIPARLVADNFDIKKILVDKKKISGRTLFVDDIYDSGDTFKKILKTVEKPENFLYATLMARTRVPYPKQLVCAKKTLGSEYVVFPWDKSEYEMAQKSIKD